MFIGSPFNVNLITTQFYGDCPYSKILLFYPFFFFFFLALTTRDVKKKTHIFTFSNTNLSILPNPSNNILIFIFLHITQ